MTNDYHLPTVSTTTAQTSRPRKNYSEMTTPERWAFHTEIYAFRAVYLGIVEPTSPCDPGGKWYDARAVEAATLRMREKRERPAKLRREAKDREMALAGREAVNRWAQRFGCATIDDYAEGKGVHWSDAYVEMSSQIRVVHRMPMGQHSAAALGVTAREFSPSPEQLRAGRLALGLEMADEG